MANISPIMLTLERNSKGGLLPANNDQTSNSYVQNEKISGYTRQLILSVAERMSMWTIFFPLCECWAYVVHVCWTFSYDKQSLVLCLPALRTSAIWIVWHGFVRQPCAFDTAVAAEQVSKIMRCLFIDMNNWTSSHNMCKKISILSSVRTIRF